jgi:pimeloyl-ACP methyl ester carboxylesterase
MRIQHHHLISNNKASRGPPPLVVLLGWLGCQPKSLRRHRELYASLGVDSLVYIAPPYCIVEQVFAPAHEPIVIPKEWPNIPSRVDESNSSSSNYRYTTVQEIAWGILQDVHHRFQDYPAFSRPPYFYVHAFSNGGCFVWEQIRRILLLYSSPPHCFDHLSNERDMTRSALSRVDPKTTNAPDDDMSLARRALARLQNQLCGVVFDSCPAVIDVHRLNDALDYCTESERQLVRHYCGAKLDRCMNVESKVPSSHNDDQQRVDHDRDTTLNTVRLRMDAYTAGLLHDPLPVPHLYLYSRDDALAPALFIDELVAHRRKRNDGHDVQSCVWDKSRHCRHLLEHANDYEDAVASFVRLGTPKQEPSAKL